jgi:uncharacterized iron-regulated protein
MPPTAHTRAASSRTLRRTLRGALLSCAALQACAASRAGLAEGEDWLAIDTARGRTVSLEAMADALGELDVVFLGEQHDNDVGHALQLRMTRLLLERRPHLVVSLEMFERDTQRALDDYLDGTSSEANFLARSRPWGNYSEHYRPVVELARAEHLPVIASNIPRPLAATISHAGFDAVRGSPFAPREVAPEPGSYRERFAAAMQRANDPQDRGLELWFTAQLAKDEAMAESIERALVLGGPGTLVVHWCGRFHSDHRLGTVERLLRRQPSLRVGVVSLVTRDPVSPLVPVEELENGDYLWIVPAQK